MFSGKLTTALTTNSATARYPLGYIYVQPASDTDGQGEKHWIYVYNDETATAFAKGHVIMRDSATATYDGVLSTNAAAPCRLRLLGVAQHAITAGYYGFILKQGIGEVLAATAGFTADGPIVADAVNGAAEDMAAGEEHLVFGSAIDSASSTALGTCYINCGG